jgi:hypothetical protein
MRNSRRQWADEVAYTLSKQEQQILHAALLRSTVRVSSREAELQAAIDELVAARNEWAYSDEDYEDERLDRAFTVARGLASK